MKKPPKIELAPQIKQRKLVKIETLFLEKILGIEGALVTDESLISHFIVNRPEESVGPGETPGTLRFVQKVYIGPRPPNFKSHQDPDNWKVSEVDEEPGIGREEIITKTKEVFGVDISDVYEESLVDILLYITDNYTKKEER